MFLPEIARWCCISILTKNLIKKSRYKQHILCCFCTSLLKCYILFSCLLWLLVNLNTSYQISGALNTSVVCTVSDFRFAYTGESSYLMPDCIISCRSYWDTLQDQDIDIGTVRGFLVEVYDYSWLKCSFYRMESHQNRAQWQRCKAMSSTISKLLVQCLSKPYFFLVFIQILVRKVIFLSPLALKYIQMQFDLIHQNSALCQ